MNLKALQEPALTAAFDPDMFGQLIQYNGAEINAIFRSGENPASSGRGSAERGELSVMKKDVPTWSYNDEAVIDGSSWRVLGEVGRRDGGSTWFKWVLNIERDRRAGHKT